MPSIFGIFGRSQANVQVPANQNGRTRWKFWKKQDQADRVDQVAGHPQERVAGFFQRRPSNPQPAPNARQRVFHRVNVQVDENEWDLGALKPLLINGAVAAALNAFAPSFMWAGPVVAELGNAGFSKASDKAINIGAKVWTRAANLINESGDTLEKAAKISWDIGRHSLPYLSYAYYGGLPALGVGLMAGAVKLAKSGENESFNRLLAKITSYRRVNNQFLHPVQLEVPQQVRPEDQQPVQLVRPEARSEDRSQESAASRVYPRVPKRRQ